MEIRQSSHRDSKTDGKPAGWPIGMPDCSTDGRMAGRLDSQWASRLVRLRAIRSVSRLTGRRAFTVQVFRCAASGRCLYTSGLPGRHTFVSGNGATSGGAGLTAGVTKPSEPSQSRRSGGAVRVRFAGHHSRERGALLESPKRGSRSFASFAGGACGPHAPDGPLRDAQPAGEFPG